MSVSVAQLLYRCKIVALPGKERDVEILLKSGLSVVAAEPATVAWFADDREADVLAAKLPQ